MNYDEAKQLLLKHSCGTSSGWFDDGFLGMLRPYQGLREPNFHQVMEALFVVGEELHATPVVERDLVRSLWEMCWAARYWGLHPDGMLKRNKLISADDAKRLETWVDLIEWAALFLLSGRPPHLVLAGLGYAQYIVDHGPGENVAFFVSLMRRALDDPGMDDPTAIAKALAKLGPIAREALPSLRAADARTYPDYCNSEAHVLIRDAIRRIEATE